MTDPEAQEIVKVLTLVADNQGVTLSILRDFLTLQKTTNSALEGIQAALRELGRLLIKADIQDADKTLILARIRTALSTDNPQLWHDALVSTLAVLGLPQGD